MIKARINKIIDMSVVDGPGNRTAIFFQGCNLDCFYCHNPETIGQDRDKDLEKTLEDVLKRVKGNMPFIQGITSSGGECTLQHKFLVELFKETKKLGLTNFVDTNGYMNLKSLDELVSHTDQFMLDIKATSKQDHIRISGKSNENVLVNAKYLAGLGKLYEIRTVVIKGMNNMQTVDEITRLLSPYLDTENIKYKIIKYRSIGVREEFSNYIAPDEEEMEKLKEIAIKNGFSQVIIV